MNFSGDAPVPPGSAGVSPAAVGVDPTETFPPYVAPDVRGEAASDCVSEGRATGSMGRLSCLIRRTAASLPGQTTELSRTVWSYCRYTQCLDAIVGHASNVFRSVTGSLVTETFAGLNERTAVKYAGSRASRSYTGASLASFAAGISATTWPWFLTTIC